MNIQDDHPNHRLKSWTMDGSIQLVPLVGDQITDGQTTRTVKERIFQYGPDEITITLNCRY